jgi:hypothetical protein
MPRASQFAYVSWILSSAKRSIEIPVPLTRRPVGAIPESWFWCVPLKCQRTTTLSPTAEAAFCESRNLPVLRKPFLPEDLVQIVQARLVRASAEGR